MLSLKQKKVPLAMEHLVENNNDETGNRGRPDVWSEIIRGYFFALT